MKVLVVDDQSVNRVMLRYLLEDDGHDYVEAENGLVALEVFDQEHPDFVLMDIMMPEMDGYESAKRIKEKSAGQHVPIIFLTAKTEQESLIQCLDHGDDYLVKPINQVLLRAKINAHKRTLELTQQIQASNKELSRLHSTLQHEHETGRHVLNHALQRSWKSCPLVRSHLSSMSIFNGDLLLVAPNPKGGVYVFLGDMTGHGLSASIGAVPVSQVFFSMCAKARPVREIAQELNQTLKEFLPDNMFCAAMILQLNAQADAAKMWAGGLPGAFVIKPGVGVVQRIKSSNLPLGILDDEQFNSLSETLHFEKGDRLLMLSDGVHDVQNPAGKFYGEERLLRVIESAHDDYFEAILSDVSEFSQGAAQSDDMSLVEVCMDAVALSEAKKQADYRSLPWRLDFKFDAKDLREDKKVLQHVFGMLPHGADFVITKHVLETVITELFANSLEHGLLGLSSEMKRDASGFTAYYQERERLVSLLDAGYIQIIVSYQGALAKEEIIVEVVDSGAGFDVDTRMSAKSASPWGRGLDMVESLSQSLSFLNGGSHARVVLSTLQDMT